MIERSMYTPRNSQRKQHQLNQVLPLEEEANRRTIHRIAVSILVPSFSIDLQCADPHRTATAIETIQNLVFNADMTGEWETDGVRLDSAHNSSL